MKPLFLLIAAALTGHLLFAQPIRVDFPEAVQLAYSPKDDILSCKVDAKSISADSGEFYLILVFKWTFVKKFRDGGERFVCLSSPGKPPLYLRPIEDSAWTSSTSRDEVAIFAHTFALNRSEIDYLKTNKIETLTYADDVKATVRFSHRSGKALMKVINDHW